jgi:hypothetical protein
MLTSGVDCCYSKLSGMLEKGRMGAVSWVDCATAKQLAAVSLSCSMVCKGKNNKEELIESGTTQTIKQVLMYRPTGAFLNLCLSVQISSKRRLTPNFVTSYDLFF